MEQNREHQMVRGFAGDRAMAVRLSLPGKCSWPVLPTKGRNGRWVCFDRKNGDELWRQTVNYDKVAATHKTNPYAGSTPASDGKHVVVWHGSAGVFCYDHSGKELWTVNLGTGSGTSGGYGSSPVLHDGKVYLNFGPGKDTFVVALELKSGNEIWRTPRTRRSQ